MKDAEHPTAIVGRTETFACQRSECNLRSGSDWNPCHQPARRSLAVRY